MENIMKTAVTVTFFAIAGVISMPAMAASHHEAAHGAAEHNHAAMSTKAQPAMPWSDGQVKKVDKAAGKVTVSHGPLANLDMPAMTMIFRVKDIAWLNQMKSGDNIRFVAENINNSLTIVQVEPAK